MISGYHISMENNAGYPIAIFSCATMMTLYIPRYCTTESLFDAAFVVLSFLGLFWFVILYRGPCLTWFQSCGFKSNDTTMASTHGKSLIQINKLSKTLGVIPLETSNLEDNACKKVKICAKTMDLESQL